MTTDQGSTAADGEGERAPIMDRTSLDMLSGILWRERDVLEQVGQTGPADPASAQLALRSLSSLELHRAILTREVASEHGIAGDPSLDDLIQGVPTEWAAVLAGHRRALRRLAEAAANTLASGAKAAPEGDEPGAGCTTVGTRVGVQRSLVEFLG